ncbi:sugar phosphate permease [Scopulibacillus darangshiensis]|uniref:Sugar phosphate permease n=1 Tax=Scopulibacillus darangshiensis TaxID=442528 RepID=A0A4V2SNL6_9BACL|nr:MFS transporter [Scopulibacillus darangshiensis]TCP31706.1 sugar phosphate permease [Scopulibacillus darangshiensis]
MVTSKSVFFNWMGVLSLFIVLTIAYIDRVNVSILITDHSFLQYLGIEGDRVAQGYLMTSFLIAYGISAFFLTPLYERFLGAKKGLLISLIIWGIFTFIAPFFSIFFLLLATRIILGLSEGPLFSLNTMYISGVFPENKRGKPNAVWALGVSAGLAVGSPFISYLVYQFSWQWSFYTLGLLNLLIGAPLILLFIRSHKVLPSMAETKGNWFKETRSVFKKAIKTPGLLWLLIWEIVNLSYLWGTAAWLPSYLLDARGFSIKQMGVLASLPFIVSLLSKLLSGYIIDRIEKKSMMWVIGGIGCSVFIIIAITTGNPVISAISIIIANGFWGIQGPVLPTTVQSLANERSVGSTYGVINGTGNLVSAFIPVIMGMLISVNFAYGFALLIGAQLVAMVCGLRMIFLIGRVKKDKVHSNEVKTI